MLTPFDKIAYAARQGARVAWYMGHYYAARRMDTPAPAPPRPAEAKPPAPTRRGPTRQRIIADMVKLFERDLANAEAGHYPLPSDDDGGLATLVDRSRRFFADVPVAAERRAANNGREAAEEDPEHRLPDYFRQNFHFQTGGYLTADSAELYDTQVEILFSGTANAMRRQCLVPVAEWLQGRDQRTVALADIGCGTGRFVRFVKEAWPRLDVTGVDLSQPYLDAARRHLKGFGRVAFQWGNAEALPFADASRDIVTAIYLFHEVPHEVRRRIAAEFARVLKPGGRLVFMDSLQPGDEPVYDPMLASFPKRFHEPYYDGYLREDLKALFEGEGLKIARSEPAFLSKLLVADKPL